MDISRYTDTTELKFDVEFVTPTFLGGADGNAEIRTAPFKNLLRRWWRVVNGRLSPEELWKRESELFGSTEKNPDTGKIFGKSKVELTICSINKNDYITTDSIYIGEYESDYGRAELSKYLGYGSVGYKSYISPKTRCTFSLLAPEKFTNELIEVLFLMHLFGTIGSRSRNGWGSFFIIPQNFKFNPPSVFSKFSSWEQVFISDKCYPNLIGKDKKGVLAWRTNYCRNWQDAMEKIGTAYYELLEDIKNNSPCKYRNLLGTASGKERLPAQVVLKVCPSKDKKCYGLIIHIPFLIEDKNWSSSEQRDAGQYIHNYLDKYYGLEGWQRNISGAGK